VGVITVNKTIHLVVLSAILGLSSFIPLSYASDVATQNKGQIHLAEYHYKSVSCGRGESLAACKARHGDVRFKSNQKHYHHKYKHKHKYKTKHKHSCQCQHN
jgi:hypothetical protein